MQTSTSTNRSVVLSMVTAVAITLGCLGGCSSSGEALRDGGNRGLRCGSGTCDPGKACCLDCLGNGTCLQPGAVCQAANCTPTPDGGGKGLACGDKVCAVGEVCCLDCDGKGTCGAPPMACSGVACNPPDAGVACGPTICAAGKRCCDHCTGSCVDNDSGAFCPDDNNPARSCSNDGGSGCGGQGQACCASNPACSDNLTCCSGVPYPEDGECLPQCQRLSDRAAKESFDSLDADAILDQLLRLEVQRWSYRADQAHAKHIGPMAQEFHTAFGLGSTDRRIDLGDANGVVMLAVQALSQRIDTLRRSTSALQAENSALKASIAVLSERCAAPDSVRQRSAP